MPIVYLYFIWRNNHCSSFCCCIFRQKYLYMEILLSTFCICTLEHGEPKYKSLTSICNVVAERMHYPHLFVLKNVSIQYNFSSFKEPMTGMLLRWQQKKLTNDIKFPKVYNLLGKHKSKYFQYAHSCFNCTSAKTVLLILCQNRLTFYRKTFFFCDAYI